MNPIPILAAVEKVRVPITDALPHLAGMLMVMLTLAILWGICAITAQLVRIFLPEKKPQCSSPVAAAPVPASPPDPVGEIAPEILAVIAAAVTATIGKPHRVVSIKPISTSWERAGRQSVLTSHRIR